MITDGLNLQLFSIQCWQAEPIRTFNFCQVDGRALNWSQFWYNTAVLVRFILTNWKLKVGNLFPISAYFPAIVTWPRHNLGLLVRSVQEKVKFELSLTTTFWPHNHCGPIYYMFLLNKCRNYNIFGLRRYFHFA